MEREGGRKTARDVGKGLKRGGEVGCIEGGRKRLMKRLTCTRVKYCAHFRVAPALIACMRVQAHTNVERRHITRLTISGAEVRIIVRYADARPQSFTLREEARSCLASLSQLSRSTLLPVIVEMHLVSGYYALKLYFFHVTHPRRKALPYVRKRDAAHTLR